MCMLLNAIIALVGLVIIWVIIEAIFRALAAKFGPIADWIWILRIVGLLVLLVLVAGFFFGGVGIPAPRFLACT